MRCCSASQAGASDAAISSSSGDGFWSSGHLSGFVPYDSTSARKRSPFLFSSSFCFTGHLVRFVLRKLEAQGTSPARKQRLQSVDPHFENRRRFDVREPLVVHERD